jgi:transposase
MIHYVGLDVSARSINVCVIDTDGCVANERKMGVDPEAVATYLRGLDLCIGRIGLEAGMLSQHIYGGLAAAGLPVICVETRHMKAALSAQLNKTDRHDARGIAQMMRVGLYKQVHVKPLVSQRIRTVLTARQYPGKPPIPAGTVARVVALSCGEAPPGVTHWTGRAMAKLAGISLRSVQRIWDAHQLQPHRVRRFKRSRDPRFAETMADVVGLYLDPPAQAVVLSIDETSQIQALDRTQPGLPLKPGRCGTMTHDDKRHGTTTLFAALNVLEGTVIGRCMQRHRHAAFIRFLNAVELAVPAGRVIEAIVDNYATHKHPKVKAWLARHPRWTFHFTPTSRSWLNGVETFFSALTRQRIRRGSFHSIVSLQAAINQYLDQRNAEPRPFVWTASAASILAKLSRLPVASE